MSKDLKENFPDEFERLEQTVTLIHRSIDYFKTAISGPTNDTVRMMVNSQYQNEIVKLQMAEPSPYFGRIDIVFDGGAAETFYIGEFGIEDQTTQDRWVIDWQTPIAGLYYEFTGDENRISYTGPNHQQLATNVQKKRQIQVEDGTLKEIYEISDATEAQRSLVDTVSRTNSSNGSLKSITATIQREQNQVIRFDKDTALIIQGVAGSGKTSVGVYRVSYLLYNHRDVMSAKDILIVGPNETFLKYVSTTLPKLQISGIHQHTFISWACEALHRPLQVSQIYEILQQIRVGKQNYDEYATVAKIKGSVDFMFALTNYVRDTEVERLPTSDLELRPELYISMQHVIKLYFEDNAPYSPNVRRQRVLKSLESWVIDQLERMIEQAKHVEGENAWKQYVLDDHHRERIIRSSQTRIDRRVKDIKAVKDKYEGYIQQWKELDAVQLYVEFLSRPDLLQKHLPVLSENELKAISSTSEGKNGRWDPEDVAPLMHLNNLLNGEIDTYSHIVIDEAQDLSPFELALLIQSSRNNSITILGDLSQSVYPFRSIQSWTELNSVFHRLGRQEPQFIDLKQSYRSTQEIINASNVLLSGEKVIPIGRTGPKPELIRVENPRDLYNNMFVRLEKFLQENYGTIAIIGNTDEQCHAVYSKISNLEKFSDSELITEPSKPLSKRIVVIPEYVVKGLEFDAVILVNAGLGRFSNDVLSRSILYVLFTRARHELVIYYHQSIATPLENHINPTLFQIPVTVREKDENDFLF